MKIIKILIALTLVFFSEANTLKASRQQILQALKEHKVVVVKCSLPFCMPCRQMAPMFKRVSEEYKDDNIVFFELNIENAEDLAKTYGVQSVPTILVFVDNKLVKKFKGASVKAKELTSYLNQLLLDNPEFIHDGFSS